MNNESKQVLDDTKHVMLKNDYISNARETFFENIECAFYQHHFDIC